MCEKAYQECADYIKKNPGIQDLFCDRCRSGNRYPRQWSHPLSELTFCRDPWTGTEIPSSFQELKSYPLVCPNDKKLRKLSALDQLKKMHHVVNPEITGLEKFQQNNINHIYAYLGMMTLLDRMKLKNIAGIKIALFQQDKYAFANYRIFFQPHDIDNFITSLEIGARDNFRQEVENFLLHVNK